MPRIGGGDLLTVGGWSRPRAGRYSNARGEPQERGCERSKHGHCRLRARDLPGQEYTPRTCNVVVQVRGECGPVLLGIVVDGVAEVLNLAAADIEDTPDLGDGTDTSCLMGLAKVRGKVKILLEIDRVLATRE